MPNTYELRPHEEWDDEEKIKARLVLINRLMEEVNELVSEDSRYEYRTHCYLNFYSHRDVDEFWDSSSAEC